MNFQYAHGVQMPRMATLNIHITLALNSSDMFYDKTGRKKKECTHINHILTNKYSFFF